MSMPQQTSSIFEPNSPIGRDLPDVRRRAKAVDYLADERFDVQNLAIVGTDLKSVEASWAAEPGHGDRSGCSVRCVDRSARRPSDVDLH